MISDAVTPKSILCFFVMLAGLTATPLAQEPPQEKQEPLDTLRVDVNVVNLFFTVKDDGRFVSGLNREDFRVFEEGKEQKIKYFSATTDQPLTMGLLIDTSGSQQRVLQMEQEVGGQFLKEVMRPKDLAFVISFDVQVELLQDLTASTDSLRAALRETRINTGGGGGLPGLGGGPVPIANPRGTLLYDAVFLASDERLRNEVGRKALIILTDGVDQGSRMKLGEAVEAAHRADAMCYILLISDREFYRGNGGYVGDREMKRLAEETGGRVIEVSARYDKLKQAFDQIAAELRSQYSLGYTPTNNARDGSFRKIEIKSNKGKVQARKGYYAPTD